MRVSLDITRNRGGHFEGTLADDDAAPVSFSGTLELLKLLDDVAERHASDPAS